MIELTHDTLRFTFPDVHPEAALTIEFQRTLRIPDDEEEYLLPPGLGAFPLRHVDDFASEVPDRWLKHGGVMLPMYQSEAMWLRFHSRWVPDHAEYPFAIKVATGKQCAVSGEPWTEGLSRGPQNYLAPSQPWLDGFFVEKGVIRQFVAMPLGAGYSAEEQLTGKAEHGGVQLQVFPMKREAFERHFPKDERDLSRGGETTMDFCLCDSALDIGLAPGGRMRQEIYEDSFEMEAWDLQSSSRCFVHLCNSLVWQSITGSPPPHSPPTAKKYTDQGLPWFDYYDDSATQLEGSKKLAEMSSVATISAEKGDRALPENSPVDAKNVVVYRKGLKPNQVREFQP